MIYAKKLSPGVVICSFYSGYFSYKIADNSSKTEAVIPYFDVKNICRYKNAFYLLAKGVRCFYIPGSDSFDPDQLEAFLRERFPENLYTDKRRSR